MPSLDEISELVSSNEPRSRRRSIRSTALPRWPNSSIIRCVRRPCSDKTYRRIGLNHGHVAGGSAPMLVGVAYWRLIDVKAAGANYALWGMGRVLGRVMYSCVSAAITKYQKETHETQETRPFRA